MVGSEYSSKSPPKSVILCSKKKGQGPKAQLPSPKSRARLRPG